MTSFCLLNAYERLYTTEDSREALDEMQFIKFLKTFSDLGCDGNSRNVVYDMMCHLHCYVYTMMWR